MEKEVTIYDIAKRLKCSPATVSRALNDHPAIRNDTKELINATARQLGYRSNTFASNLRRQKTSILGVIVPRLNSNFMSKVLSGMEKVANDSSYTLIITQSLESEQKEIANAKTLFNSRVDGLLVSVAYDTQSIDHFEAFVRKGIPVLFFDRVIQHPHCVSIVIDNAWAGYEATKHLIEQGCRRIAHITGIMRRNVYADRLAGYRRALLENGILPDDNLIVESDLSFEAGYQTAQAILAMPDRPDGIFVANDFCAVGCMTALKQAGISIPDDIAVVGFNDDPVAQVIEPTLTSIHYAGEKMGEIATQSLINHLNGRQDMQATNQIILRSELVIRSSSVR
ncbi:LacI family DNA-binding transcriptional regulator [Spirosoma harenae]